VTALAKDAKKDRKDKKNAQLVLRLNRDLRDEFVDACQDLDTSAAREVRKFIKRFLRRYEKGELDDH
jgi:undecaprenyl pyrophosphate synthase